MEESLVGKDVIFKEKETEDKLLQLLPLKAQLGFSSLRQHFSRGDHGIRKFLQASKPHDTLKLEYTCIDVTNDFIALGCNFGIVFFYDRHLSRLQRFVAESKQVPVVCLKILPSQNFLATGQFNGALTIFNYGKEKDGNFKIVLKCTVDDHHNAPVTCIQWTLDGTKLFSGDSEGNVAISVINMDDGQTHTVFICRENSPVTQLSLCHTALLVSTLRRTLIWPFNTKMPVQVGQQERKVHGNFGACFFPNMKDHPPSGPPVVYAARPGLRIWQASIEGKVSTTMIFKDSVAKGEPEISTLNLPSQNCDNGPQSEPRQFGSLKVLSDSYLVSWQGSCVWIMEPKTGLLVGCHSNLGCVVDVASCETEMFVLTKGESSFVRRISLETCQQSPVIEIKELELRENDVDVHRSGSVNQFETDKIDRIIGEVKNTTVGIISVVKRNVVKTIEHIKNMDDSEEEKSSSGDNISSENSCSPNSADQIENAVSANIDIVRNGDVNSRLLEVNSPCFLIASPVHERNEDGVVLDDSSPPEVPDSESTPPLIYDSKVFEGGGSQGVDVEITREGPQGVEGGVDQGVDEVKERGERKIDFEIKHDFKEAEIPFHNISGKAFSSDIVFEGTSRQKPKKKKKVKKALMTVEGMNPPILNNHEVATHQVKNESFVSEFPTPETETPTAENEMMKNEYGNAENEREIDVKANESTPKVLTDSSLDAVAPMLKKDPTIIKDSSVYDGSESGTGNTIPELANSNRDSLAISNKNNVESFDEKRSSSEKTSNSPDIKNDHFVKTKDIFVSENINETSSNEIERVVTVGDNHDAIINKSGSGNLSEQVGNTENNKKQQNVISNVITGQSSNKVQNEDNFEEKQNFEVKATSEIVKIDNNVDKIAKQGNSVVADDDNPRSLNDAGNAEALNRSRDIARLNFSEYDGTHSEDELSLFRPAEFVNVKKSNHLKDVRRKPQTREPSKRDREAVKRTHVRSSSSGCKKIDGKAVEKTHARSSSSGCKMIDGEAVERSQVRSVSAGCDYLGHEDTIDSNMLWLDEDDERIDYDSPPHSPARKEPSLFPAPQMKYASIYSQDAMSLSELSFSEAEHDDTILVSNREHNAIMFDSMSVLTNSHELTDVEDNGCFTPPINLDPSGGVELTDVMFLNRKPRFQRGNDSTRDSSSSSPSIFSLDGIMPPSPHSLAEKLSERLRLLADSWAEICVPNCGYVQSITVTDTLVWCVDSHDHVFATPASSATVNWRKVDGKARQISANQAGSIIWSVNRKKVASYRTNVKSTNAQGSDWETVENDILEVAVDDACIWGIKTNGDIFLRTGVSPQHPCGTGRRNVRVASDLVHITCLGGMVWGLDIYNHVQIYQGDLSTLGGNEQAIQWLELPGITSSYVTLGPKGVCWIIDKDGKIWFNLELSEENIFGGKWYELSVGEYLVQDPTVLSTVVSFFKRGNDPKILSGNDISGIWILGKHGSLHAARGHLLGTRWDLTVPIAMPSSAIWTCVSVQGSTGNGGFAWALQPNGELHCFRPESQSFVVQPPPRTILKYINASPRSLWALTSNQDVYIRKGISEVTPQGLKWTPVNMSSMGSERICNIACGSLVVWAVDYHGNVWFQMGREDTRQGLYSPAWLQVEGSPFDGCQFTKVAVGSNDCIVWAVDDKNNIYARKDVSDSFLIGTSWELVTGTGGKDITVSDNIVWAICPNGNIVCRFGISSSNFTGDYWKTVPGCFEQISVTADDELWGIDRQGQLYQRHTVHFFGTQATRKAPSYSQLFPTDDDWELI